MISLLKTYNKAKDVFVRPKLKVQFGKWRNTSGLPVWRRAPIIRLGNSSYKYGANCYEVTNKVDICTGYKTITTSDGKEIQQKCYTRSTHKLPGGLKPGDFVWIREVRKQFKKYGLSWIPPLIQLPIWMSFYIFNWDVCYKWKYDTIRYEFPPQFTIVFFGLALTIMAIPDAEDEFDYPDHYWESLLSYLYQDECKGSVAKTLDFCGQWTVHDKKLGSYKYFQLRKSHLKPAYHAEYDDAVDKYLSKNLNPESLW